MVRTSWLQDDGGIALLIDVELTNFHLVLQHSLLIILHETMPFPALNYDSLSLDKARQISGLQMQMPEHTHSLRWDCRFGGTNACAIHLANIETVLSPLSLIIHLLELMI